MQQKTSIVGVPLLGATMLVLALAACSQNTLTVSEVWENAQELDGQQIRVRGRSHVFTEPYVGLIGCPPAGVIENDVVVGRMVLFPEESDNNSSLRIAISESSLQCKGGHCALTCAPFDPGNMDYCMAFRDDDTHLQFVYEMVGTLRLEQIDGKTTLLLEDIKLSESRHLVGEIWEPIPTATVEYMCP